MDQQKKTVRVVIPIYKDKLDENEELSLSQCRIMLSNYPICFLKPKSLNLSFLLEMYPEIQIENFPDDYFKDIQSYNKLMLSTEFYERFLDYEYILIYQLDAFVFRDELKYWCERNYDYIGAPWILKPKYNNSPLFLFLWFKYLVYKLKGKDFNPIILGNKVGNGGFSLRRVCKFHEATCIQKDKIRFYLEKSNLNSKFNEDVFWALENPTFRYPHYKEALLFSIDDYPDIGLKMNNDILSFGCHGWLKKHRLPFWKNIILNNKLLS